LPCRGRCVEPLCHRLPGLGKLLQQASHAHRLHWPARHCSAAAAAAAPSPSPMPIRKPLPVQGQRARWPCAYAILLLQRWRALAQPYESVKQTCDGIDAGETRVEVAASFMHACMHPEVHSKLAGLVLDASTPPGRRDLFMMQCDENALKAFTVPAGLLTGDGSRPSGCFLSNCIDSLRWCASIPQAEPTSIEDQSAQAAQSTRLASAFACQWPPEGSFMPAAS
jgi:hypothetical protein